MKKILFSLTFVMLIIGLTTAQEATKVSKKEAKAEMEKMADDATIGGPKMTFETMVMDYGEIGKGSEPLRKFTFVNDGDGPLVIKSAKGSCGCTVPDYPKEPIMPGESAAIDVRYDTQREGQFTKTVTLTTNINDDKIVLTIKGKVNPLPQEESVPAKEGSIF
jgi:hypothetical protein